MADVVALLAANQAIVGLVVLAAMFVAFLFERFPPSVIAVSGAAALIALGLLDEKAAFAVFSNSAPLTVGAMFVLSGALIRTGVIDRVGNYIVERAVRRPKMAVVEVFGGALFASAFLNNTPVVVVLIPICFRLADALGVSPKKLLMPLSIVAVLGGCITLIGTSTNLVVAGIAEEAGLEPFGLFSITPYGLAISAAGVATMLALLWLLPSDRPSIAETGSESPQTYLTELVLLDGDPAVDMALDAAPLPVAAGSVVALVSGGRSLTGAEALDRRLAVGDRIVIRADGALLMTLRDEGRFGIGMGSGSADKSHVVEVTIAPTHPSIGRPLLEIPFMQRQRVRILGVSRFRHLPGPTLAQSRIRAADRLLVEADEANIRQLKDNRGLIGLSVSSVRAFRHSKAWIAVAALVGVVLLSALDIVSIGAATFVAVAVILLAKCIDASEAWASIDGDVLILIFAMLAVGSALESAGSVALMVDGLMPWLTSAPPWAVIAIVYFSALILSELLSNNAVAALMAPLVIGLAEQLGVDARPLLIALMLGASACFATPVGYQTNTLVYAAGDYRFIDFVKLGVPLNIVTGLTGCLALAWWA